MIARQRERKPAFDQMNPGQIRSASPLYQETAAPA